MKKHEFAVMLFVLVFIPLQSFAAQSNSFDCSSLCKFLSKGGAFQREQIKAHGRSKKLAWKKLKRACFGFGTGQRELQIVNPKFSTCKNGESAESCAEPEFLEATPENSCANSIAR